jgi:hypothetical protein
MTLEKSECAMNRMFLFTILTTERVRFITSLSV